ncbi:MAG: hypothetical protein CML04_01940 [Pseudozobellia sp.]|nr:hypothetical protein [Pseudozobellia sp.]MBG48943.1 hypothetical protein [Pseudozobellia sp.]|tara:strand:+ start:569 stop:853 length:285 start_codon:yes stop_codon:yes gene_type:complete
MRETTVDKEYKKAFNQGYQFAKEIGLNPNTLKDLAAENPRMQAIKDGMEQYNKDISLHKNVDLIPPLDLDSLDTPPIERDQSEKNRDKGMDIEL